MACRYNCRGEELLWEQLFEADEYACSAQKEGAVHICVTTSSDLIGISSSQKRLGSRLLEDFTLALS